MSFETMKYAAGEFFGGKGVEPAGENVVFAEHEIKDEKGNVHKYDREALKKIVDKCNARIKNTGDYAVITAGHTPPAKYAKMGAPMPDVIGYAGPFKLAQQGTIEENGKTRPRTVVVAEEWVYPEHRERLERLPRRSVEVWMADEMKDRFFDPVAALGAETPRLDLGMKFSAMHGAAEVMKYSAPAVQKLECGPEYNKKKYEASTAAGNNSFVASMGEPVRNQQGAEQMATNLAPDDIQEIVKAISELDYVQWAKKKMREEEGQEAEAYQADEEAAEAEAAEGEPEDMPEDMGADMGELPAKETGLGLGEPGEEPEQYGGDMPGAEIDDEDLGGEPLGGLPMERQRNQDDGEEYDDLAPEPDDMGGLEGETLPDDLGEEPEQLSRNRAGRTGRRKRYEGGETSDQGALPPMATNAQPKTYERMTYQLNQQKMKYDRLYNQHQAALERIEALESIHEEAAEDRAREEAINLLSQDYDIDPEDLRERALYSRGADMSSAEFSREIEMVQRYCKPQLAGRSLPIGRTPSESANKSQIAARAVDYAQKVRDEGGSITSAQAWDHVAKEFQG